VKKVSDDGSKKVERRVGCPEGRDARPTGRASRKQGQRGKKKKTIVKNVVGETERVETRLTSGPGGVGVGRKYLQSQISVQDER